VCQPPDHAVAAQIKCGGVIAAGAAREGAGEAGGGWRILVLGFIGVSPSIQSSSLSSDGSTDGEGSGTTKISLGSSSPSSPS
jgi:hypothetical protein